MRTYKSVVEKHSQAPAKLGDVLYKMTKMSPEVLADAVVKGAVWLQKAGKGKILRARSIQLMIDPKDVLSFYHEAHILKLPELNEAECVFENKHYGIWVKEAGVVAQGTQAGDHSSLLRYVEKTIKHDVYLIHRLDRETRGLMIVGYTKEAAGKLSTLFTENKIKKTYEAIVVGEHSVSATINEPLDGKEAITHVQIIDSKQGKSHLRIQIQTGRLHQIRRHLEFIGTPILGDPKYGKGNKNKDGLKLVATELSFIDPWNKESRTWPLPSHLAI